VTRAKRKVAVLISGRGSNLAALIAACDEKDFPATICLVASNRPEAAGLTHAERNGMATRVVDHTAFARNTEFEQELDAALRAAGADIVCLAGFMRLLSPGFVELWRDRMLNIHPSLLPLFPGLRTHERALAAGVKIHGATVHFVRAETDSGPIVAQGAVPVLPREARGKRSRDNSRRPRGHCRHARRARRQPAFSVRLAAGLEPASRPREARASNSSIRRDDGMF
jgi:phosphoribosylglycinamide formyltransferase-1